MTFVGTSDGDTLLEANETAQVTVPVSSYNLYRGKSFTIEVKPQDGAVVNITRDIPKSIADQMILN